MKVKMRPKFRFPMKKAERKNGTNFAPQAMHDSSGSMRLRFVSRFSSGKIRQQKVHPFERHTEAK